MKYEIDIDVEDLGISTEDLISLAEDNGDRLYDDYDLEFRIEEAVADARAAAAVRVTALCARVRSLEDEIHTLRNEGFIETTKRLIKDLEEENADLKMKAVDLEAIAVFVQTSLRVEAIGIADCIRRGDYSA